MNKPASYCTAAVPEPVRVLGLELKPFCIGHYITLNRFGSAFVSEKEEKATAEEVIFAAVVCHFSYEDFYIFIRQKDALEQIQTLGNRFGKETGHPFDRKEKAKLLLDYINEASQMPGFALKDGEASTSGAHWVHSVLASATGNCGYTQSEALNAPMKKVLLDFLKHAENNGAIAIISDEQMALMAAWDKN